MSGALPRKARVGGSHIARLHIGGSHVAGLHIGAFLLAGLLVCLFPLAVLAVLRSSAAQESHRAEEGPLSSCFMAPGHPEDRRRNKDSLTVANFNVEWLFMRGGVGRIACPSESCPWAVHTA